MALRADDVDLGRDRSLVEQFQAGDPGAFDDLYRRYFPRLYRFCLKRVGDTHEAEELAQEAFARAYRHMDDFAGERRFYPWMTVIAGRLCVDTHRRRARSQPSDTIDLGSVDGGQDAIIARVDVAILEAAIAKLAPRHREVLELRERQGYSYQRIADHYGVTLGTVEALLWRARKALRREFLALTGGEEPVFGAVPAAGAGRRLWGRLLGWRVRLGQRIHHDVQPVLAGAAAMVTAAAIGLGAASGAAGPAPTWSVARPVAGHGASPALDLVATHAGTSATRGAGGAVTTAGAATVARAVGAHVDPVLAEIGRQPVHAFVGSHVGAGIDPPRIVADTAAALATTPAHAMARIESLGGRGARP